MRGKTAAAENEQQTTSQFSSRKRTFRAWREYIVLPNKFSPFRKPKASHVQLLHHWPTMNSQNKKKAKQKKEKSD